MIFSSVNAKIRPGQYPEVIENAINFFRSTDFDSYQVGEYEISGRDILFQVHDLKTESADKRRPEVHRKYIDVQYLYEGKEFIGTVNDTGKNESAEDLLKERDLLFYKSVENETLICMNPGDFCVFFPEDVHRPACERGGESMIRKIVYKINVELLN